MSRPPALLALLLALAACGGAIDSGPDGSGGGNSATGGGDGQACGGADTWSSFGASFFGAECGSCHQFTHAQIRDERELIASAISTGWMPQSGPLPAAARARVLAYLGCGAP